MYRCDNKTEFRWVIRKLSQYGGMHSNYPITVVDGWGWPQEKVLQVREITTLFTEFGVSEHKTDWKDVPVVVE